MSDAMLVFDGSGSMAEMGYNGLNVPRIFEAREAMARTLPFVTPHRALGLVIYGPGGQDDACANITLRVPPARDTALRIISEINLLEPDGKTPLTGSVALAVDVLLARGASGDVVLVTDGKETCEGQTCQLAARLVADAPGITVHVIGFRVRSDQFQWESVANVEDIAVARCLADRTGGGYYAAEGVDQLIAALIETLGCSRLSLLVPPAPGVRG